MVGPVRLRGSAAGPLSGRPASPIAHCISPNPQIAGRSSAMHAGGFGRARCCCPTGRRARGGPARPETPSPGLPGGGWTALRLRPPPGPARPVGLKAPLRPAARRLGSVPVSPGSVPVTLHVAEATNRRSLAATVSRRTPYRVHVDLPNPVLFVCRPLAVEGAVAPDPSSAK